MAVNKFLPTVFDVLLKDNVTGGVIGTAELASANIDVSTTSNDVRGGQFNQLLAVFDTDRDISVSLTDVTWKFDWLAVQLGQTIVTGAGTAYAMPKTYTAGALGVVTLDETPTSIDSIALYVDGVKQTATTNFTLTGADVSPVAAEWAADDLVEVRTYIFATDAATETITIDNAVFPNSVTLVMETPLLNANRKVTEKFQGVFTNALPSGNFSVSTTSEGAATNQEFSLRIVAPDGSSSVGTFTKYPV